jgi:hypothetical protein
MRLAFLGVFFIFFAKPPTLIRFSRWAVVTSKSLTRSPSLEFRILNERGFEFPVKRGLARTLCCLSCKAGFCFSFSFCPSP